MAKKTKQSAGERKLFIPQLQSEWVPFVEEGFEDSEAQVEVLLRKNLTLDEIETLYVPDPPPGLESEDLVAAVKEQNRLTYEAMAPFMLDWNMGYVTPSGEHVKADPPAVGGPEQIERFLSPRFAGRILHELRTRNTGMVKAARSTPLERMDATSGDVNETPTGTEEA